jgi:predicted transcriptional regulator
MNSAIERLLTLRVGDVMNAPVAFIRDSASMAEAARVLTENEVTGAPVVDQAGRCVGMLSATDFAERERRLATCKPETAGSSGDIFVEASSDPLATESLAEDCVTEHMSPLVQTIGHAAPIMNAARTMCREHIHRLVIVNDEQQPVGVVSSLDLVAAMVAAVEE